MRLSREEERLDVHTPLFLQGVCEDHPRDVLGWLRARCFNTATASTSYMAANTHLQTLQPPRIERWPTHIPYPQCGFNSNHSMSKGPKNIKKTVSHVVPTGKYRGEVISIFPPKDKKPGRDNSLYLRVQFAIPSLENATTRFQAGKNYLKDINPGSELMRVASVLLGRELTAEEARLPYLALKPAIGKELELHIVTGPVTKRHPHPFSHLQDVKPAGTWLPASEAEFVDHAAGI